MSDRQRRASSNAYWIAFAACAAIVSVPFLVTYRVPINDLPQHAAQITLWKRYFDPCYRFDLTYFKDWFTPYLLGYSIARLFAIWMSVNSSLKVTAYLAVVALPLALRRLIAPAGIDPWLALLGFPLAFGFTFYWGFLNFFVAIPLGILFVAFAYDYSRQPDVGRGTALALLALVLLASHALVFAVCLAIAAAMYVVEQRSVVSAIPYMIPLPFALLWAMHVREQTQIRLPPAYQELLARPLNLPWRFLASDFDPAAYGFVAIFVVVAVLVGLRPSHDLRRWLPLIGAALCYFFGPASAFGTTVLFQRFAVFLGVFALFALDPGPSVIAPRLSRGLMFGAIALWFAIVAVRFARFSSDARGFDRIVDGIPSNESLLYLDVTPQSDAVPGLPFLHFAAYYQQRKGGIVGRSFASEFPRLIRYRSGRDPGALEALERDPSLFRWDTNDSHFDFFLVRADADYHDAFFRDATEPVDLRAHNGLWWLYAKRRMAPHDDCPPFEPDDAEGRRQ